MAKAITTATISPRTFATGRAIYHQHLQTVAHQLNYTAAGNPQVHVSLVTGQDAWGSSGNEIATHNCEFPAVAGLTEFYAFRIYVDSDVQVITVGAKCTHAGIQTGDVKFILGSDNTTISFDAADVTELTDTMATADIVIPADGWVSVTIQLNNTSASPASGNTLDAFRIENNAIAAADLPDPVAE